MHQLYVLAAGAVAGLAAWCTQGTLDLTSNNGQLVRLAMLPPLSRAALLALLGAITCLVLDRLMVGRAGRGHAEGSARDFTAPLLATAILVLPYLPRLPDAWPALTVLAGPAKYLVWIAAVGLSVTAAGRAIVTPLRWRPLHRPSMAALAIFVATLAASGAAATRLVGTPIFPGGDEPHYLVIAQSLWRDGDLRIENNHQRGDTAEYFTEELAPHYLTRGKDGEIYSVHPVGLPVLLAPVYAAGGYHAVVAFLVLVAALVATLAWRFARHATTSGAAATFGWAASTLSAPFLFNSFAVYPEMVAALMVIAGYGLATGAWRLSSPAASWWACGCAIAALPWLSTKYVLLAAVLGIIALGYLVWPPAERSWLREWRARASLIAMLCVPPFVSLALWFTFFWIIWGTPSPTAPYGDVHGTELRHLLRGGPGLFFDQEYGLLATAPALWLGIAGLAGMARDRARRRTACEVTLMMVALLVLVGAFHIWWGGSGAVGRPMIAVLPLLAVPIAWRFQQRASAPGLRVAYIVLVALGLALAIVLASSHDGLLLANQRNGVAPLLVWASPSWNLAAIAPSFIVDPQPLALLSSMIWLGALLTAGVTIGRVRRDTGTMRLVVLLAGMAAFGAVSWLVPLMLGAHLRPPLRPESRGEVPMLHDFSPSRRPLAIRYEPFDRVDATTIPSMFRWLARAGDERAESPVPLLHGARWSLPAGRYAVTLVGRDGGRNEPGDELRLRIGRLGPAVTAWPVTFDDRGEWTTTFDLPLASTSVGFAASESLASLAPALVLTPVSVQDTAGALPVLEVLAAGRYGPFWTFMHGDRTVPEPEGFWTPGEAAATFTITGPRPPRLRLRAGPVKTMVAIALPDRRDDLVLAPGEIREVPVTPRPDGAWRITIAVAGSFVPAAVDPASRDRRRLGVFVELGDR